MKLIYNYLNSHEYWNIFIYDYKSRIFLLQLLYWIIILTQKDYNKNYTYYIIFIIKTNQRYMLLLLLFFNYNQLKKYIFYFYFKINIYLIELHISLKL